MKENILKEYIMEELILTIRSIGFLDYMWIVGREELISTGHLGRDELKLFFLYKESENVLPEEGFVPGCGFSSDFTASFLQELVRNAPQHVRFEPLSVERHNISLEVYYDSMYVPVTIYISPERRENIVPARMNMELPVHEETVSILCYPIEQEAALHFFIILKELELINEMEHYYYFYKIFKTYTIDGVRFQNALATLLDENKIPIDDRRWQLLMSYGSYSYMKNKWRNWIKRQDNLSLDWSEVHNIVEIAVSPIREAILENRHFFGDWMPDLMRYLV